MPADQCPGSSDANTSRQRQKLKAPKITYVPNPEYTNVECEAKIRGKVVWLVEVDEQGRATNI